MSNTKKKEAKPMGRVKKRGKNTVTSKITIGKEKKLSPEEKKALKEEQDLGADV